MKVYRIDWSEADGGSVHTIIECPSFAALMAWLQHNMTDDKELLSVMRC